MPANDRRIPNAGERTQVPAAQVVSDRCLGRAGQDVFLAPGGAAADHGFVEPGHRGQRHRCFDQLDYLGQHGRAPGQHPVYEPHRWRPPTGQVRDQPYAALHRHMLVDDEVDHQRPEARPIAGGGSGHLRRERTEVFPATAAADPPHVMLGHRDGDLGRSCT
jgi:hypothetical protein